jgi:hypothetical protein
MCLTTLCLGVANALSAAEPGHACAVVDDDAERLACYDRAFGSPYAPSNGAGSDEGSRPRGRTNDQKKDFTFTAMVRGVEIRRDGMFQVTLDNEQIWTQTELNSRIDLRVGATVTIRRGALGSYLLSNSAGISTRVRRQR